MDESSAENTEKRGYILEATLVIPLHSEIGPKTLLR